MASTTEPRRSPDFRPSRRALLASAALVAPATLLPAIAAVAAEQPVDPHLAWAAEADRLRPAMDAADPDTADALAGRICDLHGLIADSPARTLAGVREQVRVLCHLLGLDERGDDGTDEVAAARNMLATLERLTREARHV